jgi:hypothetical protein
VGVSSWLARAAVAEVSSWLAGAAVAEVSFFGSYERISIITSGYSPGYCGVKYITKPYNASRLHIKN